MTKAAFRLGVGFVLALLGLISLPAVAFERAPLPSEAPMEPCPREGAGFVRIPGTTTCLRLSGRVAAGLQTGAGRTAAPVAGRLSVDTRSETDLGPVRSFVRIDAGRH
ncbi:MULTISPECIES: porin [Methylobacteriaceae]|uniref:porin n=1 Tax=Methylobacteriaceae TaxID=119045 RepID=UPI002F350CC0